MSRHLSFLEHDLALRSVSLKEATIFKLDVYWVGLYLEVPDTPPDSLFESSQPKAIVIHFVRDIPRAKLQEAWLEDLNNACQGDCRALRAQARVLARKVPDVRSSQTISYVLLPDRVEVLLDGSPLGTLIGENAGRSVLAAFLGPGAPKKLREDLLRGLSQD